MKKIYSVLTFLLLVSMVLAALCTSARSSCCAGKTSPARLQPTPAAPAEPTQAPAADNTDAPAVDTNEPVTIDLWQHDSGGKINGMKAVIAEFNKQYPNITINQTVVPYDDYQTKIAASVPAGTGPDVAMSYFGWIPLWAKSGFIVP